MLSDISLLQGGVMKSHVHLNHFLKEPQLLQDFILKLTGQSCKNTGEGWH